MHNNNNNNNNSMCPLQAQKCALGLKVVSGQHLSSLKNQTKGRRADKENNSTPNFLGVILSYCVDLGLN
jgi:hypothetical protein